MAEAATEHEPGNDQEQNDHDHCPHSAGSTTARLSARRRLLDIDVRHCSSEFKDFGSGAESRRPPAGRVLERPRPPSVVPVSTYADCVPVSRTPTSSGVESFGAGLV
jgi:hypothetical protein